MLVNTIPRTSNQASQRGSSHFNIIDASRYCKELDDVIAVANMNGYTLPTDYQLRCTNTLVNELVSNSIFKTYDLLYISGLGYGNIRPYTLANASLTPVDERFINYNTGPFTYINYKNPKLYKLSRVNTSGTAIAPFHSQYGQSNIAGIGVGSLGYFDTGYVPGTNGINWTLNNAGCSVYAPSVGQTGNGTIIGTNDTVNTRIAFTLLISNGTNLQTRINGLNTTFNTANTDVSGFFRIDRSASNLTTVYKNGVSIGTNTGTPSSMTGTTSLFILSQNLNGSPTSSWPGCCSFVSLGASLSSSLQKIEYELFTQFRSKLGY